MGIKHFGTQNSNPTTTEICTTYVTAWGCFRFTPKPYIRGAPPATHKVEKGSLLLFGFQISRLGVLQKLLGTKGL